jgi:hypothetical protein
MLPFGILAAYYWAPACQPDTWGVIPFSSDLSYQTSLATNINNAYYGGHDGGYDPAKRQHQLNEKYESLETKYVEQLYKPGELKSHIIELAASKTPTFKKMSPKKMSPKKMSPKKMSPKKMSPTSYESKLFTRVMGKNAPRLKYKQANYFPIKPNIHWGQLKLMLTEVEFIALAILQRDAAGDKRPVYLVYPGSAPGHHMNKLSEMFPDVYFELYDPNNFIPSDTDRIKTHVQFFTNKDATQWKSSEHPDKYIIFNTDIRTFPATPQVVADNMQMQRKWFEIMQPELSMFKFRLPWGPGQTQYPDGEIYIQPFCGQSSTETRLIVRKNAPMIDYDHIRYEEQCAYHNNVMRSAAYHEYKKLDLHRDRLDNCYDCTAFLEICRLYLQVMDLPHAADDIIELARDIADNIVAGKNLITQTNYEYTDKISKLRSVIFRQCAAKCSFCTRANATDLVFNKNRMHSHLDAPDE